MAIAGLQASGLKGRFRIVVNSIAIGIKSKLDISNIQLQPNWQPIIMPLFTENFSSDHKSKYADKQMLSPAKITGE